MFTSSIRSAGSSSRRLINPTYIPRRRIHNHPYPEFKPPPISARLKPLIPFFIYWCAITSLAVHLLRNRTSSREELDKTRAQISVLNGLITRFRNKERVAGDEVQRELEMVGLRERVLTQPVEGEGGDVGWFKAIFGRKGVQDDGGEGEQEVEEDAVVAWAKGWCRSSSHFSTDTIHQG